MEPVIFMFFRKLRRSIEGLPRGPYIFLKNLLRLVCAMLTASLLLHLPAPGDGLTRRHLAVLFLENPAGVLLLGLILLAALLDLSQQ